ncbi:PPOX class F420-dependent oxidoreductase [Actinopolymorpha alba]|uniref:PPOX class F420-dependent oxidoreductase n=1 Tax=Actinopolymorpha alba TaxID=533267 RepID=UPI00037CE900|nr:PPOX class F420-dependent oxidoreductase [Actinopolymorpha alba]
MPLEGSPFARFTDQKTVLLTTFRRDGTPVPTPVHIVVNGDHAYFRTYDRAGKTKRLRRNPLVELTPSTFGGTPQGVSMRAQARLLPDAEARWVRGALAGKYPFLQRRLVPLFHRLKKYKTLHYELTAER